MAWVHGDSLCEVSKVHPLLKPYKCLSEKVFKHLESISAPVWPWMSWFPSMHVCFRIKRFTAGQSERAWRRCCRGVGASSGRKRATRPRYTTARAGYLCPVRWDESNTEWELCWDASVHVRECVLQRSIEGAHGFCPQPVDMSNVTLSRDLHVSDATHRKSLMRERVWCDPVFVFQSMAELLAENYHNIWAQKKKLELESKGPISLHHNHPVK